LILPYDKFAGIIDLRGVRAMQKAKDIDMVQKWKHPIELTNEECFAIADQVPCGRHYFLLASKYGVRRFSPEKAMRVEQVTGGKIQKWMLRPDIWAPPPEYVFPSQRRYRKHKKITIEN
jgi:hypothetical protein